MVPGCEAESKGVVGKQVQQHWSSFGAPGPRPILKYRPMKMKTLDRFTDKTCTGTYSIDEILIRRTTIVEMYCTIFQV